MVSEAFKRQKKKSPPTSMRERQLRLSVRKHLSGPFKKKQHHLSRFKEPWNDFITSIGGTTEPVQ